MAKKNVKKTPRGTITAAIRQLWLRSRERAFALKRDEYKCQECGLKQSKAKGKEVKVQVDHIFGIKWDKIIDLIYKEVLPDPEQLQVLCVDCHDRKTERDKRRKK